MSTMSEKTDQGTVQTLDEWFLNLLACPACPQHLPVRLNTEHTSLDCECGRFRYPIRDGIPILLEEEADVLNPDARPSAGAASP